MDQKVIFGLPLCFISSWAFCSDPRGLVPFLAVMIGVPALIGSVVITLVLYKKYETKTVWIGTPVIFLFLCLAGLMALGLL